MLTYQDREIFKTQIKDKEREYFKKKNELQQLKEDIIWNIDEYEKMFGKTDNFDRMKREKFYPNGTPYVPQYAPGYKPNYPQTYGYNNVYNKPRKKKLSINAQTILGMIACIIYLLYLLKY